MRPQVGQGERPVQQQDGLPRRGQFQHHGGLRVPGVRCAVCGRSCCRFWRARYYRPLLLVVPPQKPIPWLQTRKRTGMPTENRQRPAGWRFFHVSKNIKLYRPHIVGCLPACRVGGWGVPRERSASRRACVCFALLRCKFCRLVFAMGGEGVLGSQLGAPPGK